MLLRVRFKNSRSTGRDWNKFLCSSTGSHVPMTFKQLSRAIWARSRQNCCASQSSFAPKLATRTRSRQKWRRELAPAKNWWHDVLARALTRARLRRNSFWLLRGRVGMPPTLPSTHQHKIVSIWKARRTLPNDRQWLNRFWGEERNDRSPNENLCHKVQNLYCYFKGDNTLPGLKQTQTRRSTQSTKCNWDSSTVHSTLILPAAVFQPSSARCPCGIALLSILFIFYSENVSKMMCLFWERNRCMCQVPCFVRSEKTHAVSFDLLRATQYVIIFGRAFGVYLLLPLSLGFMHVISLWPFSCTTVSIWSPPLARPTAHVRIS